MSIVQCPRMWTFTTCQNASEEVFNDRPPSSRTLIRVDHEQKITALTYRSFFRKYHLISIKYLHCAMYGPYVDVHVLKLREFF